MVRKIILLVVIGLISVAFSIPDKLEKKADKIISKFYKVDSFSKETIIISEEIDLKIPSDFSKENFFKIHLEDNFLGYGYIGIAASKDANFDYLVLFDSEYIITKSKVLIYREKYGGEIGSKRWLRQFNGKSIKDKELVYNRDIIPISGATISARSMTNAINDLLKSIDELQKLNKI